MFKTGLLLSKVTHLESECDMMIIRNNENIFKNWVKNIVPLNLVAPLTVT